MNINLELGFEGMRLYELGHKDKGKDLMKRYIEMDGDFEEVYTGLVDFLKKEGNKKEAKYYDNIRIKKFSKKLELIREIKNNIKKNDIEKAKIVLSQLEKDYIYQISSFEYSDLAMLFGKVKEYEIAANCNDRALLYNSENGVARNHDGVYRMMANLEKQLKEKGLNP